MCTYASETHSIPVFTLLLLGFIPDLIHYDLCNSLLYIIYPSMLTRVFALFCFLIGYYILGFVPKDFALNALLLCSNGLNVESLLFPL